MTYWKLMSAFFLYAAFLTANNEQLPICTVHTGWCTVQYAQCRLKITCHELMVFHKPWSKKGEGDQKSWHGSVRQSWPHWYRTSQHRLACTNSTSTSVNEYRYNKLIHSCNPKRNFLLQWGIYRSPKSKSSGVFMTSGHSKAWHHHLFFSLTKTLNARKSLQV